jgi:hypothetical protein
MEWSCKKVGRLIDDKVIKFEKLTREQFCTLGFDADPLIKLDPALP